MNAQFHSSMMDIKYASHGKNMCTKYGRSRMNDAHTMSTADLVGLPAKVARSTALFSKKEDEFCTTYVSAVGRLTLGVST